LVSYARKHNQANGERNRDGHGENFSSNSGVEGPTDDPAIRARRDRRRRNLLASLMLSQGTPMVLAGDELGHSQGGNNNAYCQDNAISWIDWSAADADLIAFVQRLTALRRRHPTLRQPVFLHADERPDGTSDVGWMGLGGAVPDWNDPGCPGFAVRLRGAATDPAFATVRDDVVLALNASDTPRRLSLPADVAWVEVLSTADPETTDRPVVGGAVDLAAESLALFRRADP
ncbi:MAG: glycogen debranching enzyme GlgX, partial [Pseudomonadota bacterium]